MDRRMLYLGILLFVVGLAAAAHSVQYITPAAFGTPSTHNIVVRPGSTGSVAMELNQTGIISTSYAASNAVDFVFSNASGLNMFRNGTVSSGIYNASFLEGAGILEISMNSTAGSFPLSYGTAPSYIANVTVLSAGTYYASFFNKGNANITVMAYYLVIPLSRITSASTSASGFGLASVILILIGIVLMAWSFFRKSKQTDSKSEEVDNEAKRLYAEIENKARRKKTPPKPKKRRRK